MTPPYRMPHRSQRLVRIVRDEVFSFPIYEKIGFFKFRQVGIGYGIYA